MPGVLRRALALAAAGLVAVACNDDGRTLAPAPTPPTITEVSPPGETETFLLTSPAFVDRSPIPVRHTCAGENLLPPLDISGVPDDTVELAIVVDDSDAGGYIHFFAAGLPPSLGGIAEGVIPAGAVVLVNDAGRADYDGPCPPEGTGEHRYVFTLYALREPSLIRAETPAFDARLTLSERSTAIAVLEATFSADQA